MSRLFLVGMPGAGKTTLGQALAAHLRLPFLDLDAEIARRAGQSISAIFAQKGEIRFRQLEADVLREVGSQQAGPLVLATGGGTPCFHQNMPWLNTHGLTLWLDVPLPELARRLQAGPTRPLLASTTPAEWLRANLAARRPFYQQAQLHCAAEACTAEGLLPLLAAAGFPAGGTHLKGSA